MRLKLDNYLTSHVKITSILIKDFDVRPETTNTLRKTSGKLLDIRSQ